MFRKYWARRYFYLGSLFCTKSVLFIIILLFNALLKSKTLSQNMVELSMYTFIFTKYSPGLYNIIRQESFILTSRMRIISRAMRSISNLDRKARDDYRHHAGTMRSLQDRSGSLYLQPVYEIRKYTNDGGDPSQHSSIADNSRR